MSYNLGIDATKMPDARTALICARLHLRGGKRRLQKGLTAAGMVALYDSILFGMHYYLTRHERCASFLESIEPWDAMSMFQALTRAGVFEDSLTFHRFSLIVERALWQESFSLDAKAVVIEVEQMLATLGVMPFHVNIPRKKPGRSD
jgi:hypothetical protein